MWIPHHRTGPWSVPRLWKEAHRSMNTRSDFWSVAFKGSAMAAATAFLSDSDPALAGSVSGRSVNRMEDTINNDSTRHYKPPFRFGMGGVPLGNAFAVVTDKDAYADLEAAWAAGVRYYDVAPWYGLGLAERRVDNFLHTGFCSQESRQSLHHDLRSAQDRCVEEGISRSLRLL
jgi:Aldo/keto reductase family